MFFDLTDMEYFSYLTISIKIMLGSSYQSLLAHEYIYFTSCQQILL
jgi:hypothetical protein